MSNLQKETQKVLNDLEATQVPTQGFNYFTVGDNFRSNLLNLKNDILSLTQSSRSLEKVIIGGFGTSKTHFLAYLEWLLKKEITTDNVIVKINLTNLRFAEDFQFMVVQNMQLVGKSGGYGEVLQFAYTQLQSDLGNQRWGGKPIDVQQTKNLYATLIYLLLGKITGGWINKSVLDLLGENNWVEKLSRKLSRIQLDSLYKEAQKNTKPEYQSLVDAYLELIGDPENPSKNFDKYAKMLSSEGHLTDLIFRILCLSKIKAVIILSDEVESFKSKGNQFFTESLVQIRNFRDTFNQVGSHLGYPSIALVCALTGESFYNSLKQYTPELFDRWDSKVMRLGNLTEADIDNLIFKLRELFFLAGHDLMSIQSSIDNSDHEVIEMRKRILSNYGENLDSLSSRKLIFLLIKEIKSTWYIKYY